MDVFRSLKTFFFKPTFEFSTSNGSGTSQQTRVQALAPFAEAKARKLSEETAKILRAATVAVASIIETPKKCAERAAMNQAFATIARPSQIDPDVLADIGALYGEPNPVEETAEIKPETKPETKTTVLEKLTARVCALVSSLKSLFVKQQIVFQTSSLGTQESAIAKELAILAEDRAKRLSAETSKMLAASEISVDNTYVELITRTITPQLNPTMPEEGIELRTLTVPTTSKSPKSILKKTNANSTTKHVRFNDDCLFESIFIPTKTESEDLKARVVRLASLAMKSLDALAIYLGLTPAPKTQPQKFAQDKKIRAELFQKSNPAYKASVERGRAADLERSARAVLHSDD